MTPDELKTLGQTALARLDSTTGLEREHYLRDLARALDELHGMVTRLSASPATFTSDVTRLRPDAVHICRDEALAALAKWQEGRAQVEDSPDRAETVVALADEVLRLHADLKAAELRTASTGQMAAHWKLKAQGGNYDATQEDCPGCAEQRDAERTRILGFIEGAKAHAIFKGMDVTAQTLGRIAEKIHGVLPPEARATEPAPVPFRWEEALDKP